MTYSGGIDIIKDALRTLLLICALSLSVSGCAEMPIKDGELAVGKDTSATLDDVGVAKVTNRF